MSITVTVKIEGLAEAQRALEALPEHVAQQLLKKALMAGATIVRTAMRQSAPVGYYLDPSDEPAGHRKYGSLLHNIRAAVLMKQDLSMTVGIGVGAAFWGLFQEFGTVHAPARPWMRPAFDGSRFAALDKFQSVLGQGIMDEAERVAFHKSGVM